LNLKPRILNPGQLNINFLEATCSHDRPLYTDKVSKFAKAGQWKPLNGRGLRGIDSVNRLSKLGDDRRLNAETQRGGAATKRKEQKSRQKNGGRKIFNAENTEECRETQSCKVAKRNSLNAGTARQNEQPKRKEQKGKSKKWRQKDCCKASCSRNRETYFSYLTASLR